MPATIDSLAINITANAKGANRSLNNLTKNLESLGKALGGVDTKKMQSLANSIKTIGDSAKVSSAGMKNLTKATSNTASNVDRTTTAVKLFSSHTTTLAGRMKALNTHTFSLARTFGILYANLFLVIRAYKKLEEYIESSMDYVETYNYFSVTLDKIGKEFSYMYDRFGYEDAEVYAESFSARLNDLTSKMTGYVVGENGESILTTDKNLGLDLNTVMNFQAKTAAITNSVGLVGEASVITSEALTMLASDLSSFTNQDIDTVMTNLTSGLVGQSRALYKYGIDITSTTLETYALANGISKAVSEMTQAEKMQLRELAILDQSKVAWGDQANTLNSVANQYRMFTQATANLGRTIGNLFLPIVQKALPYVNGLVIALNRLFTSLGMNLWGENWLTELMDGISSGYSDAGAEALEDYADDLTSAADAAEEYKNQLLGFDAINKLQSIDESTSGSGSGVVDLTEQLQLALADYKKVWQEAFDNAENLAQQYAEAIYNGFKKSPLDLGAGIASWINGKIKDSDWTEIGTTIGDKISYIPTLLSGVAINLEWDDLGTRLGEAFEGINDAIPWKTVGAGIGSAFTGIFKTGGAFFKSVNWGSVATNVASGINEALKNIKGEDIAGAVNAIVNGAFTFAETLLKKLDWKSFFGIIGDTAKNLDWFSVLKLGTIITSIFTAKTFLTSVGNGLKGALESSTVTNSLTSAGETLGSKLATGVGWFAVGTAIGLAISNAILKVADMWIEDTTNSFYKGDASNVLDDDTLRQIEEAEEKINEVKENAQTRMSSLTNVGDTAALSELANKYLELRKAANPTEEEKTLMQGYYNYLAEKLPGFADAVGDVTVSYEEQKAAIDGLIDSLWKQSIITALQDNITDTIRDIVDLQFQLDNLGYDSQDISKMRAENEEIEKQRDELQKLLDIVYEARGDEEYLAAYSKIMTDYGSLDAARQTVAELNQQYTDNALAINKSSSAFKTLENAIASANGELDYYSDLLGGVVSGEFEFDFDTGGFKKSDEWLAEQAEAAGVTPTENPAQQAVDSMASTLTKEENIHKLQTAAATLIGATTTEFDKIDDPKNTTDQALSAVGNINSALLTGKAKFNLFETSKMVANDVVQGFDRIDNKANSTDQAYNVVKNLNSGLTAGSAKFGLFETSKGIANQITQGVDRVDNYSNTTLQGLNVNKNLLTGLSDNTLIAELDKQAKTIAGSVSTNLGTVDDAKNTTKVTQDALWNYSEGLYWTSGLGRLDRAVGGVTGKFEGITKATDKEEWSGKAKNVLTGLYEGLQNGTLLNKVSSGIAGLAQRIGTVFASLLGIHSPSTVFESYGRFIDIGLANGIEGNLGYVSSATASLGSVTSDFGLSLPSLSGSASYTVSTSTSGGFLEQIAGAVAVAMQNANITINPSYEVKVGNERLTGVVVKEINRQTISAGKSPILI